MNSRFEWVFKAPDLSWAAYIAGHPERLPRDSRGETWADVSPAEYHRVTRNWRAWQRRRRRRLIPLDVIEVPSAPVPVEAMAAGPDEDA